MNKHKLRLLANLPLKVDNIPIYSPILRDIAEVGLEEYGMMLTYSTITKENLIEPEKIYIQDNYDSLLKLIYNINDFISMFLYSLCFFTKINFIPQDINNDLAFVSEDIILDRNNYDNFVRNIRFANRLETDNIEELDEFDRICAEQEKKIQEATNKNVEQPNFEDLVSAVANFDGNGLNIINIWDLNVYQFNEQLQRGQLKENYNWSLKQLLAGAKPDDIKLESYLKNIK